MWFAPPAQVTQFSKGPTLPLIVVEEGDGGGGGAGGPTILTIWTTFCTYWLSIKIKISMTCKYPEYSIKMKIVWQLWTQFKMKFLLSYNMEIVI